MVQKKDHGLARFWPFSSPAPVAGWRYPAMRYPTLVSLILPLAAACVAAAPPRLETVDLFHAGQGGYAYYRIPGLVVTAKGTVLAYCEARREGQNDWENIDVLLRRSTDGGRTWEAPRVMGAIPGPHHKNPVALAGKYARADQVTYSNPVAIATRDGTVHFFFCLEFNRCFYRRSDDDGATFSPPEEITSDFQAFRPDYDWHIIAAGPGHGIELHSGRLVLPFWMSTGVGKNGFNPSAVGVIVSDDQGRSWRAAGIPFAAATAGTNPTCGEVVELSQDRVMMNARSSSPSGHRLIVIGGQGGTQWGRPYFDPALVEQGCMGGITRLSEGRAGGKDRILFSNPDDPRARANLSIKLSYDEGATWPVKRQLEPGPSSYSDLAVLPDGTILCLYERGVVAPTSHQPTFLSVARFNLEWLTDGRDRLP